MIAICVLLNYGGSMKRDHNLESMNEMFQNDRIEEATAKMTKAINRVLSTISYVEAGSWRISSDNIAILKEAIKE